MALDEVHIHLTMDKINGMKMMSNRVLVEVFDTRNKISNIFIPITEDNPFIPDRGVVFKVCSDACFNIGDCVIIERYKGKRVFSDDNRQFILLDKSYVLAKIEK